MLATIFHMQHYGRNVYEIGFGMSARRECIHINNLARLYEQLRESDYVRKNFENYFLYFIWFAIIFRFRNPPGAEEAILCLFWARIYLLHYTQIF